MIGLRRWQASDANPKPSIIRHEGSGTAVAVKNWKNSFVFAVPSSSLISIRLNWESLVKPIKLGVANGLELVNDVVPTCVVSSKNVSVKTLSIESSASVSYTHLTLPTKRIV